MIKEGKQRHYISPSAPHVCRSTRLEGKCARAPITILSRINKGYLTVLSSTSCLGSLHYSGREDFDLGKTIFHDLGFTLFASEEREVSNSSSALFLNVTGTNYLELCWCPNVLFVSAPFPTKGNKNIATDSCPTSKVIFSRLGTCRGCPDPRLRIRAVPIHPRWHLGSILMGWPGGGGGGGERRPRLGLVRHSGKYA